MANRKVLKPITGIRLASHEEARRILELTGDRPEVKERQFWYDKHGALIIVSVVTGSSEFSSTQVFEFDRCVILLYPLRDFNFFTPAPMIAHHDTQ